jgi:Ca2+-binding EF-hand superfamily protein
MLFEEDEIEAILHHVFGLNQDEISYVLRRFFNFATRKDKSLTFDELVKILLEVYLVEIILKRRYKDLQSDQWKTRRISLQEFIELVLYACFFLKVKPTKEDLTEIFKILDTDNDGYLTFAQYIDFIRKYLGLGIQPE